MREVPLRAERRRQAADLGGHQRHPVVVKLLTERQCGRWTLIEAGHDHRAADSGDSNCLVQRGIGTRQFDHPISAASLGKVSHRQSKITIVGRQRSRAELACQLQSMRHSVDGHNIGALGN